MDSSTALSRRIWGFAGYLQFLSFLSAHARRASIWDACSEVRYSMALTIVFFTSKNPHIVGLFLSTQFLH
jgi:hypothetical protein